MSGFPKVERRLRGRVKSLTALAHDPERAHSEEDSIRENALRWIAEHSNDARCRVLAQLALETSEVKFGRWCA